MCVNNNVQLLRSVFHNTSVLDKPVAKSVLSTAGAVVGDGLLCDPASDANVPAPWPYP